MTDRPSHYVRFAQRLAMVGSLGALAAGCALAVGNGDAGGDTAVASDAADDAARDVSTMPVPCDPANLPAIYQQPCATVGEMCGSGCGAAACRDEGTPASPRWIAQLCGGPMPPPELA